MSKDFSPKLPIDPKNISAVADFYLFVEKLFKEQEHLEKKEKLPDLYCDEIARIIEETNFADMRIMFWGLAQRHLPTVMCIHARVSHLMINIATGNDPKINSKLVEHFVHNDETCKRNPKAFPFWAEVKRLRNLENKAE